MPQRLSVIISQAERRDNQCADIEEAIVAELLMTAGLDANLVRPLSSIQPDSTDYLCLSGLNQDLVLIGWYDRIEAETAWKQLELGGEFIALQLDEPRTQNRTQRLRTVNYLQLHKQVDPQAITNKLKSMLRDRQTQVVNFTFPALAKPQPTVSPSNPQTRSSSVPADSQTYSQTNDSWSNLDKLVDDLDAMEL